MKRRRRLCCRDDPASAQCGLFGLTAVRRVHVVLVGRRCKIQKEASVADLPAVHSRVSVSSSLPGRYGPTIRSRQRSRVP